MADLVLEQTGGQSQITHVPYSEAYAPGFEDMRRRVPDVGKISRAIDWKPELSINDILTDVVAYETRQLQI